MLAISHSPSFEDAKVLYSQQEPHMKCLSVRLSIRHYSKFGYKTCW